MTLHAWDAFEAFQLALGDRADTVILPFGERPRMLYVRPPRRCEIEDFPPILQRIVESSDLPPDLPTLWDFRGHDFSACTAQTCRDMAFHLGRFAVRRGVKRGLLVDSGSGFGSGRMFQQTMDGFALDDLDSFLVSYSAEEIIAWLASEA